MSSAQALLRPVRFSPRSISGLKLWLEADRITGLNDSDPVGTWSDLSGNGNHATQGTAAAKPLYKMGILNGRPVVRYDGTDDVMALSGVGLNIARNVVGLTMFFVWIPNSVAGGGDKSLVQFETNAGANRAVIQRSAAALLVGGRRLDADSFESAAGGTVSVGVPTITSATFDYANVLATIFKDGVQVAQDNPFQTAGSTSDTASTAARIGAAGPNLDAAVALVYNRALASSERKKIERYLGRKYGIAVS